MVINKTSCLITAFLKNSVSVLGRVSCLVSCPCHMSGRATRKCKATVQQANRTNKRVKELLELKEDESDSDSEDDKDSSSDEDSDSL